MNVVRMENDTSAVAFYRGMHFIEVCQGEPENLEMVIDIGGGSFSVAIYSPGQGMLDGKVAGGDCNIGGFNIDKELAQYCAFIYHE